MNKTNTSILVAGVTIATSIMPIYANEPIEKEQTNIDVNEIVKGYFLTSKGEELVEMLLLEKEAGSIVEIVDSNIANVIKFDLVIKNNEGNVIETIGILSDNAKTLSRTKQIINDKLNKSVRIDLIAGDDRYKTAVEISKATYNKSKDVNGIILIGKNAIVDGLAASPLAAQKNAPILLANKNELTQETEEEIVRLLGENPDSKTIYIVGGTNTISQELEKGLNKLGVKSVERISGSDRYGTSLAIANKLDSSKNIENKAFVVGGNGEADAMSISAKAAELNAPIIVTNKNKLSQEISKFLNGKEIEIIGGNNSVSKSVENELVSIDNNKTIERLAGDTRKDTNTKIINKYYQEANQIFVAKEGNASLIDALAAAPLAGREKAPIVLSTDILAKKQEEAIKDQLSNVKKVTQIGNGVATSVIDKIIELTGLFN